MWKVSIVVCVLAAACNASPLAGSRRPRARIVGGQSVDVSQYPWQASVDHLGVHDCGAAVISVNWVLTAAQCLYDRDANEFSVRAGTSTRDSGGSVYGIAYAHLHESYNDAVQDYNIAAISISGSFTIGTNIQAVHVATSEPQGGALATVSGWGALSDGGEAPEQLQAVTVAVVDRETCAGVWDLTANMICAGGEGAGVCSGDAGSPLVVDSTLFGIAYGNVCATQGKPDIYTNVAAVHTWITQATGV